MSPLDHEPEACLYARKNSGLSQAAAASAIKISAGLLSEIEKGTRNATPAVIRRMAVAYNCPVVVLERKRYIAEAS